MQDIDKILALEIKRELADRYFGFRKAIENDIQAYDSQILDSFRKLEQKIGFNLIRLYILLHHIQLIQEFFRLTGLKDTIFFDPYLMESKTIKKRLFRGLTIRGLSKKKRFKNIFLDIYCDLTRYVEEYRAALTTLTEEQETIAAQIKLFYEKNDLSLIMGFLRGLDESGIHEKSQMAGGIEGSSFEGMEKKMRVAPPQPVEMMLPFFLHLQPLERIKPSLKKLISRAFTAQGEPEIKDYIS